MGIYGRFVVSFCVVFIYVISLYLQKPSKAQEAEWPHFGRVVDPVNHIFSLRYVYL